MAISNNPLFAGMSGKMGPFVFRQCAGKTIVCLRPGFNKKLYPGTEAQIEVKSRFIRATRIADKLLRDPEIREFYAIAASKGQSAHSRAVQDAMRPPEVISIDASGYIGQRNFPICIHATDDLRVENARLSISGADGTLIEEGEAWQGADRHYWFYVTTTDIPFIKGCIIKATVYDLPGNEGVMEIRI